MENIKFLSRLTLLLSALLTYSVLLTSCAALSPGPTATPTEPPCKTLAAPYVDQLAAIDREWTDAFTLANKTSRIALSPAVANLQAIKRKIDALPSPKCAWEIAYNAERSTTKAIEAFMAFMSQDSDSVVTQHFKDYQTLRTQLFSTIDKILER